MKEKFKGVWTACADWFREIGWIRRRILLIMLVLLGGWVLSGLIFWIFQSSLTGDFLDDTWRGIFAAWMGELIFFTFVGGIIAVLGLRNPMQENFEERIHIMFGRNRVPDSVMQYNRQALKQVS